LHSRRVANGITAWHPGYLSTEGIVLFATRECTLISSAVRRMAHTITSNVSRLARTRRVLWTGPSRA
jgi:hypothetical protein